MPRAKKISGDEEGVKISKDYAGMPLINKKRNELTYLMRIASLRSQICNFQPLRGGSFCHLVVPLTQLEGFVE